jgi:DNA processing protein
MTQDEYYYWLANISNIGIKKISLLLEVFESPEVIFKASKAELLEVLTPGAELSEALTPGAEPSKALTPGAELSKALAPKPELSKAPAPVAEPSEALASSLSGRRVKLHINDINNIINSRNKDKIKRDYAGLADKGIRFIHIRDGRYPEKLKKIYDPPFALYVKGRFPKEERFTWEEGLPWEGPKCLAVVGSRECSGYGAGMTGYLAGAVAREGIGIISGLARGIDTHAHEGALSVGGKTYAVLGCGADICYPRENFNLYMAISEDGGIISEYAPGVKPISCNFPMRNRIISGLSDGILVVEAGKKSGALITVDMGLDQGKDIYAVPGRVGDRLSEGCNNLIKSGAKLVSSPDDILEELLNNYKKNDAKCNNNDFALCTINNYMLETQGKIVYACLGFEPVHLGEISAKTGLPLEVCMEQLLLLELNGLIVQKTKNYYSLRL